MKTLLLKFIPGIALVAVAALAFVAGNAKAENRTVAAVGVEQPRTEQPAVGSPPAVSEPAPRVVYVVVREADVIRWAPAYYGPQCYAAPVSCDPFTEVRVNPIPYPVNYCAPSLFGPVREFRHALPNQHGRR